MWIENILAFLLNNKSRLQCQVIILTSTLFVHMRLGKNLEQKCTDIVYFCVIYGLYQIQELAGPKASVANLQIPPCYTVSQAHCGKQNRHINKTDQVILMVSIFGN
jgi:hypothetical protein